MQCLPLYSLLLALGNPTVDFLSLDIEGAEFQVLKTIPWDKVDIRALSVKTQFAGDVLGGSGKTSSNLSQVLGSLTLARLQEKTSLSDSLPVERVQASDGRRWGRDWCPDFASSPEWPRTSWWNTVASITRGKDHQQYYIGVGQQMVTVLNRGGLANGYGIK